MAAPNRGDLVWLTFDPQAGREQAGRRPALVLSPRDYNALTAYCVVCPITSMVKGYPFEVVLPTGLPIAGAVLADQIKSIDRNARKIEVVGAVPQAVIDEVTAKAVALINPR